MAKKLGWRLLMLAVVVGLVLSSMGCASLFYQGVETEESKKLLNDANDILLGNPDGYSPVQFKPLFERKYPNIQWDEWGQAGVRFTYQDKKYTMTFSNISQQRGNQMYIYWVSANKCRDMTPPKQSQ